MKTNQTQNIQAAKIYWRQSPVPGKFAEPTIIEVVAFFTEGSSFVYVQAETNTKVYVPMDLVSCVELGKPVEKSNRRPKLKA